jgi:glycosyltransferase involved in cell wall biosynthesis
MQSTGGASIACNRISDALRSNDHHVLSISSDGINSDSNYLLFLGKKFEIISRLFGTALPHQLIDHFQVKELHRQLSILLNRIKPDLINVHNLHSAGWPISLVRTCLHFAPVVWTLHDCWSFLGSYYPIYSAAQSPKLKCEINKFWESVRRNSPKHSLCAATPSVWMKNEAKTSHWADYNVEAIHNPVPDSFFATRDRKACKRALSLNESKTTILCIAGNLDEERKGGPILSDILAENWGQEVEFLLIGNGYSATSNSENVKCIGFLKDEITLQIAYAAADILLHPAPIDNLPNTVAESMSCGTPVLAFDTGGLPEMITHEKSGWLEPSLNSSEMIHSLKNILKTGSHTNLRNSTREIALNLFQSTLIGEKYYDLFPACGAHS